MTDSDPPLDVTRLVLDHHEVLYRYAYRLTGSVADAEDLTQQVFLIAHTKAGQLRDAQSVRGWLYTVLRNCYLRNGRRRIPMPASSVELDMAGLPQQDTEQPVDGERVQAAINGLADEFKFVVMLYYFEQRSYREMAEILDVPLGTIMSRLSRAKDHLREHLAELDDQAVPSSAADKSDSKQSTSKRRALAAHRGIT